LYTDSARVCSVLETIETAYIGPANDEQLFHLFHELRALVQQRQHPYFVSHLTLAFLGHWQRAIARLMPWFLH
jgi:2'-5' RNA ligase